MNPKRPQFKGLVLRVSAGAEARYAARVAKLVDRMIATTEREVVRLFESRVAIASHVTTDASISSQARILTNSLMQRFEVMFAKYARPYAETMVDDADRSSELGVKRSLRAASDKIKLKGNITNGVTRDVARASIAENVGLIKSIPQKYLTSVQGAVMRSITTGNGLQDLQPFLEKQKGQTKRSAKNMALDQTRKAYNSLNKARMEKLGVQSFEWIHTGGGQKPRPQHVEMSGEIYSFAELPIIDNATGERGIPGQLPNCRCVMRPVVDLNFGEPD